MNKHELIGNVGQDPKINTLPDGTVVANFSVATTSRYTDQYGKKAEKTDWHTCKAFGKLAEIIRDYVHKGSKIYVAGPSSQRKWQDAQGNDRYSTEITVKELELLTPKRASDAPAEPHHGANNAVHDNGMPDYSDIPLDDEPY